MATTSEIVAFIELLGGLAVAESNRRIAAGQGFVLPSVCIAQSALETGWGTSGLMTKANAFFGIKAGGSWTGVVYSASTWEVENGEAYNTTANFRAYGSLAESVADYYDLITTLSRYSNAVSYGSDGTKWLSPKETITAIHAGGYATDTLYVNKIMNTINARDLTQFDGLITGAADSTTPVMTISIPKSEFIQGRLQYSPTDKAWNRYEITSIKVSTTSIENLKTCTITADYVITGAPDIVNTIDIDWVDEAGNSNTIYGIKPGEKFKLYAGYTFSVMINHDEIMPSNMPDFTLTISPHNMSVNTSDVLAYFVKVE